MAFTEPYHLEARHQLHLHRRGQRLPICLHCGQPIVTEYLLSLVEFGVPGALCQVCVSRLLQETIMEE